MHEAAADAAVEALTALELSETGDATAAAPVGAEDPSVSKTEASQQLKGNQSYYYWHSDAERRRTETGEVPAPMPQPQKLASSEVVKEKRVKNIDTFSFLDDSDVVKIYISLEGTLAGVTISDIEAKFSERSLLVSIDTPDVTYRFVVDRLARGVDPARCKASVTKSRKLLLKLHKERHLETWTRLRAS